MRQANFDAPKQQVTQVSILGMLDSNHMFEIKCNASNIKIRVVT